LKSINGRGLAVLIALVAGGSAYAQPVFVKPASTPRTPVVCSTCPYPATNAPAVGYDFPIKTFVGRYVDSSFNSDWQQPFRTARAGVFKIAPNADPNKSRIYTRIGNAVGAYSLERFFSQTLQRPMMTAAKVPNLRFGLQRAGEPIDSFSPWDKFIYPETINSGWTISDNPDGQDRLYGMDWDDRGYVYTAYSMFGWGINLDDFAADGNQMTFVTQISGADTGGAATQVISLKAGSRYYALVGLDAGGVLLYDVTDAAHPSMIRKISSLQIGSDLFYSFAARNANHDVLAVSSLANHNVSFYSAASLVTNDAPMQTFNGQYTLISSDGAGSFVASEAMGSSRLGLSIFTPSGSSYSRAQFNTNLDFIPTSVHATPGFIVVGSNGSKEIRIFKLQNGQPVYVPLNNYVPSYYFFVPTGNAQAMNIVVYDAAVFKQGTKLYLILGMGGLGDVYEIQAGDALAAVRTKVGDTPNLNIPAGSGVGPFPGDAVTFTSSTSGLSGSSVIWDFGNPEANTTTASLQNVTAPVPVGAIEHQYSGITAANVSQQRTVAVRTFDGSADPDSLTVQLQAPTVRVKLAGTSLMVTGPSDLASASVIAGDQFVDASDGAVEGHVDSWAISSTGAADLYTKKSAPDVAVPAVGLGVCGDHGLTLDAAYGPYDTMLNTLNVTPYTLHLDGGHYVVRPFALGPLSFTDAAADGVPAGQVKFSTTAKLGDMSILSATPSGQWAVTWTVNGTPTTTMQTRGVILPLTINKPTTATGSVSVSVSIPTADLVPSCQPYATATASVALNQPTPAIPASISCTTTQPCSVTDTNGADAVSWRYEWTLKLSGSSSVIPGGVLTNNNKTYSFAPGLPPGVFVLTLAVTNAFGTGTASTAVTRTEPPCSSGAPTESTVSMSWYGQTSHCSPGFGCTLGESINFSLGSYGYSFSDCDKYDWDFGDGSAHSPAIKPTHTYLGSGPYTVSAKLNGGAASVTLNRSLTFGTTTTGPTCSGAPSANTISLQFFGGTSQCLNVGGHSNPACTTNETIAFSAASVGYNFNSLCDTYDWDFGDNSAHSVAANPLHAYTTARSYPVTLRLSGGAGTAVLNAIIDVAGGGGGNCNGNPTADNVTLSYFGATSKCSFGTSCKAGETISFNLGTYGYSFLACDTFDWQFGDGQISSARNPTHVFPASGTSYNVQVKITSGSNSVTLHTTVNFGSPAVNETVDFSYPGTVATGSLITFQVLPPANTKAIKWRWDFGDNINTITTNNKIVTNTYQTVGTYPVTVFALDAAGNILAQKTHAITAAKPSRRRGAHSGG
jgi:PKD repeat protein